MKMRSLGSALILMTGVLFKGGIRTQTRTEGRPCEHTGRRQPFTSAGEGLGQTLPHGPQREPTPPNLDLGQPASRLRE